jgi:hypothetical protein
MSVQDSLCYFYPDRRALGLQIIMNMDFFNMLRHGLDFQPIAENIWPTCTQVGHTFAAISFAKHRVSAYTHTLACARAHTHNSASN